MNAQRSFDPSEHLPHRQTARGVQPQSTVGGNNLGTTKTSSQAAPRRRSRVKLNPVYAHRRQGLEVATKLVTYSSLSIFGIVTLVNLIGYNWSQQSKLPHVATEVQDAKIRIDKINSSFNRSFDPASQRSVTQENSYKVAPDQRQIFLVSPASNQSLSNPQRKQLVTTNK